MASYDAVLPPFDLSTAVVLVTGASGGIGLGLVDELTAKGSRVIITGRREEELKKVQAKYGKDKVLQYYTGDAGKEADRAALFAHVSKDFPDVNVLVNNAGIQRRGDISKEIAEPWSARQQEIDINLSGPIHLTSLFIPFFLSKGKARPTAIINVTSGLAFVPFPDGPVYGATKAGLHQYTEAIRPLLANTNLRMVELIPPPVKSNLGGTHDFGEECDEFCCSVVASFAEGKVEFGFKQSEAARMADRPMRYKMMQGVIKLLHTKSIQQP